MKLLSPVAVERRAHPCFPGEYPAVARSHFPCIRGKLRRFLWATTVFAGMMAWGPESAALAQLIGFETLPDTTATTDGQQICNEYAVFGLTLSLLDRTTGVPIGCPSIAKVGPPRTAFEGCLDGDLPYDGQGLGQSFVTDDGSIGGVAGDLLISYTLPVSQASGVIVDVDCRNLGAPPCEQWTITARDAADVILDTVVLDAPQGASDPDCESTSGPGESTAFGWQFDLPGQQISSVLIRYTGAAANVGLAFDNLSVSTVAGPPQTSIAGPRNEICGGQAVELLALTVDGTPPFTYQWEEEVSPGVWAALGTTRSQIASPAAARNFRVTVMDDDGRQATSAPFLVEVVVSAAEPACNRRLLVSSYLSDRVLRYDPTTLTFVDTFVPVGSGGLDGTNGVDFGPDDNLYVASQLNASVRRYDGNTGGFIDVFVSSGSGGLSAPTDIVFGPDGDLYVADRDGDSVLRYGGATGSFDAAFVPSASGGLDFPTGLVFGPDGDLYVSSRNNSSVKRYDGLTGAYLGDFVAAGGGGLNAPHDLEFGPDGNLYIAGEASDDIRRYDGASGAALGVFVPAGSGGLDLADDVAFGREGNLYVTSFLSDQVLVFGEQTGLFLGGFPLGNGLDGPTYLLFDSFCGDGTCDAGAGESSCTCTTDCGGPPVAESNCGDGVDEDCDALVDCTDVDCSASLLCAPAGAVPDGSTAPGVVLQVLPQPGGDLTLTWGSSCLATDDDYAVYEGRLSLFSSHVARTCSTGGVTQWTLTPSPDSRYYLVVPRNGAHEGSYGTDSLDVERPSSSAACRPQLVGVCE